MRWRVPVAARSSRLDKLGVQLEFAGNYGWHSDDLYFVASSKHLDSAHVDY